MNETNTSTESSELIIVRHKGGTGEKRVKISQLVIPDLWHIAMAEMDLECRRMILECWHIAHDLKRTLENKDWE